MSEIAEELLIDPDDMMTLGDFVEFTLGMWEILKREFEAEDDREAAKKLSHAIAILKKTYRTAELMDFSPYERQMNRFLKTDRPIPRPSKVAG